MDKLTIKTIRTARLIIETARIEVSSKNKRELADPKCVPVVTLYTTILDYSYEPWKTGSNSVRIKRKLIFTEAGLFWQRAPFHPANEDEIIEMVKQALAEYFG